VNSRPRMYSSTSTGCRYLAASWRATSRSSASVSQTLFEITPFDDPSATGFTISGQRRSRGSFSLPDCMRKYWGVRIPAVRTIRLARTLASAAGSLSVYGMSRSSRSAGTWDSRFRPSSPSAMLKATSMLELAKMAGSSEVASRSMTSWPYEAMASRIAWSVSGESYSASESLWPPSVGRTRFTLKAKPTLSGPIFLGLDLELLESLAVDGLERLPRDVAQDLLHRSVEDRRRAQRHAAAAAGLPIVVDDRVQPRLPLRVDHLGGREDPLTRAVGQGLQEATDGSVPSSAR